MRLYIHAAAFQHMETCLPTNTLTYRPTSSPSYTSTSSSPPFHHVPRPRTAQWLPTHAERGGAGWPYPTRSTALRGRISLQLPPIGSRSGSPTRLWLCITHSTIGVATLTRIPGWRLRSKARIKAYRSGGSTRMNSALPNPTASADAPRTSPLHFAHFLASFQAITAAKSAFSAFMLWHRQ